MGRNIIDFLVGDDGLNKYRKRNKNSLHYTKHAMSRWKQRVGHDSDMREDFKTIKPISKVHAKFIMKYCRKTSFNNNIEYAISSSNIIYVLAKKGAHIVTVFPYNSRG